MAKLRLSVVHLRSLKNALRDKFPEISSSHISEALAAAFGFKTNIAFVEAMKDRPVDRGLLKADSALFSARLQAMGCFTPEKFSFSDIEFGNTSPDSKLPQKFRANIGHMLELEGQPNPDWEAIHLLRYDCIRIFAQHFELGTQEPRDHDKMLFKSWNRGIDSACKPGWGRKINTNRPYFDFYGTDHEVRFVQNLPLSNGKHVEYASAMVSMPYIDFELAAELDKSQALADLVGWTCEELAEWSWYAARSTTLVLYKRKTSHAELTSRWETSFKRWLIENKSTLTKSASGDRRRVILDAIDCPHLPLDLRDYDDCRERYLKEFAEHLYYNEKDARACAFRMLIETWQLQLS